MCVVYVFVCLAYFVLWSFKFNIVCACACVCFFIFFFNFCNVTMDFCPK